MAIANIKTIPDAGFTASYTGLIACLTKCKRSNIYPNILWFSKLYSDDITENIFYKYFNLVGFEKPTTITQVYNMGTWEQLSEPRMEWRKLLCKTYADHIRVCPEVSQHVDSIFKGIDFPIVGVHIRNTDRSVEPQWASPGIQYVIKRLIDVLREYTGKVGVYIASDNIPDVVLLKNKLKERHIEMTSCF